MWKSSSEQHRIPLSSPTWAQRTDIHWELLMVMERGRRNVNNLPLLTHIRLRSQSSFAGMEPMKRNTGHPQEGMLSWHRLMHLHSSLSFFFPRPVWFMIQLEQQTVYLIFILKYCCYPWDLIKIASFGTYRPPYCQSQAFPTTKPGAGEHATIYHFPPGGCCFQWVSLECRISSYRRTAGKLYHSSVLSHCFSMCLACCLWHLGFQHHSAYLWNITSQKSEARLSLFT